MVLGLPPTVYGKSIEHEEWPGTITYSGDTLRAVMMDIAKSVARSGFSKLVLLGSHGGNNGIIDDYFRDLRMATGLRVFKIHLGSIGNVPGLTTPEEAAVSMHGGDSETSAVRHLAPELVDMSGPRGTLPAPPGRGVLVQGAGRHRGVGLGRPLEERRDRQPAPVRSGEGEDRGRGEGRPAGRSCWKRSTASRRARSSWRRARSRPASRSRPSLLSEAVQLTIVILKGLVSNPSRHMADPEGSDGLAAQATRR